MSKSIGVLETYKVKSAKELKDYLEDTFKNIKAISIYEYYGEERPTMVIVLKYSVWSFIFYKSARLYQKDMRNIISGILPEEFDFELIISVI